MAEWVHPDEILEPLWSDHAVPFDRQFLQLPVIDVVHDDPDPSLDAHIGRYEELLRICPDQDFLRAWRRVAPKRDAAVIVMVVCKHREHLLADAECRLAPGFLLEGFRKGKADASHSG